MTTELKLGRRVLPQRFQSPTFHPQHHQTNKQTKKKQTKNATHLGLQVYPRVGEKIYDVQCPGKKTPLLKVEENFKSPINPFNI